MSLITEICVDSIESVIQANLAFIKTLISEPNATSSSPRRILRFELCSALHQGGLTPSVGFVKTVLQTLSKTFQSSSSLSSMYDIELFLMIRCRPGLDFVYTFDEMEVMLSDIEIFGKLFFQPPHEQQQNVFIRGVVFGALKRENNNINSSSSSKIGKAIDIDHEALKDVCSACEPFDWTVTFHRAIDYLGEDAKPLLVEDSKLYFDILMKLATDDEYKKRVRFVLTSGGITHNTSENEGAVVEFLFEKLRDVSSDSKSFETTNKKLNLIFGGGVNKRVIEKVSSQLQQQQQSESTTSLSPISIYGVHFSGKKVIIPEGVPSCEAYWKLDKKLVEEMFEVVLMMNSKNHQPRRMSHV